MSQDYLKVMRETNYERPKNMREFTKMVRSLYYDVCGGRKFVNYFNDKRTLTRRKIFKSYGIVKDEKVIWNDVLNILKANGYDGWELWFNESRFSYSGLRCGIKKVEKL